MVRLHLKLCPGNSRKRRNFDPQIPEVHNHGGVVQLQLNHALVEASFGRQVFRELGRRIAVNRKLKVVPTDDYVHVVPIVFVDVAERHCAIDRHDGRIVVLIDHEALAPMAAVFTAAGRVKIPRTEHLIADPHVADVDVIGLKIAPAGFVLSSADVHAAVSFAQKSIAELHFEIGDLPVFVKDQITASFLPFADDHAVAHRPCPRSTGRADRPAIKRLAIEHRAGTSLHGNRLDRIVLAGNRHCWRARHPHGRQDTRRFAGPN